MLCITLRKALFPYQHVIGIIIKFQQPISSSCDYLWHHYSIYKDFLIPLARLFSGCNSNIILVAEVDSIAYQQTAITMSGENTYRRQCNRQSHWGIARIDAINAQRDESHENEWSHMCWQWSATTAGCVRQRYESRLLWLSLRRSTEETQLWHWLPWWGWGRKVRSRRGQWQHLRRWRRDTVSAVWSRECLPRDSFQQATGSSDTQETDAEARKSGL